MNLGSHGLLISVDGDRTGELVHLAVRGELDRATAGELNAALSAQLAAGRRAVRVDLSGLAFCGAAGLNALLAAHLRYQAAAGTLTLAGCGPRLIRYLAITRLDRILHLAASQFEPGPAAHPRKRAR